MPKIIIGADFVPTPSNEKYFETGDMKSIVSKDLMDLLSEADYRIFDLETPLTDKSDPIEKAGPNLISSTKCINGYKSLKTDFVTIGNNHIMDQGKNGLWSTIRTLEDSGIAFAGAGRNLEEAYRPFIFECGASKIGIYCCAEHEFSIAGDDTPGANPFDPLESLDHIVQLKAECDYVICLYHGGKEKYRYLSPELQKRCRKIVEKGADLVICQHSHCIGCKEKWKDGTIVYGQGNFIFDRPENSDEFGKSGLLITIEIGEKYKIDYIPVIKDGNGVRVADANEYKETLSSFSERSNLIRDPKFVENEYRKYAITKLPGQLMSLDLFCDSLFFRVLNKICAGRPNKIMTKKKIKKHRSQFINRIENEAYRELILKGLKTIYR